MPELDSLVAEGEALGILAGAADGITVATDADVAAVVAALDEHRTNTDNPHAVTKAQVGLGNADNTADVDKPVSTAQQTALDGKVSKAGDTMTGDLFVSNVAPRYALIESDQAANAKRWDHRVSGTSYQLLPVDDAGAPLVGAPVRVERTGLVTFAAAQSVVVPAISGTNQAAQVTGFDAAIGRLAVGGREIGDTDWRSLPLENGWAGSVFVRRIGMRVEVNVTGLNGTASTSTNITTLPSGFRCDDGNNNVARPKLPVSTQTVNATALGSMGALGIAGASGVGQTLRGDQTWTAVHGGGSFITNDAWPATLPGTPA